MRRELRVPANKPASRASRVRWRWQNLADSVLLGILGGTIGWRIAYSLLRGIACTRSMGSLAVRETGIALQLVLGQEPGMGDPRVEFYLGLAHLTYHGLVRQIRGMVRVALPQIRAAGENGASFESPLRYRYSTAHGMRMFPEEFETRLRLIRGVAVRVDA